jgi:dipeptide/tripeptide permease
MAISPTSATGTIVTQPSPSVTADDLYSNWLLGVISAIATACIVGASVALSIVELALITFTAGVIIFAIAGVVGIAALVAFAILTNKNNNIQKQLDEQEKKQTPKP